VDQPNLEFSILRVDESCRIRLPQPHLKRVGWITGDQSLDGWLLVGSPGRCRLISAAEVDTDTTLRSLRSRIAEELDSPSASAIEFSNASSVALALRLVPAQIARHEGGWRLTIPKPVAAVMRISPGESDVAALSFHGNIEIWTIEALTSAIAVPLREII
jgi:hypothetical protein